MTLEIYLRKLEWAKALTDQELAAESTIETIKYLNHLDKQKKQRLIDYETSLMDLLKDECAIRFITLYLEK